MMMVSLRPPLQVPFFYGWVILGVLMSSTFVAASASQALTSLLVKPIADEVGMSRTAISGAITFGSLIGSAFVPLTGMFADRYGARLLLVIGASLMLGALTLLSNASELWHFYLGYLVVRGIGPALLSGVVINTTLVNWFARYRGRVIGIFGMVWPLYVSAFALVAEALISAHGWRSVYFLISSFAIVVIPLSAWLLRRRPEDVGLLPDGATVVEPAAQTAAAAAPLAWEEGNLTLRQAVRTRAFWLVAAAQFCAMLGMGIATFHWVPYYTDAGAPASVAAGAITTYMVAQAVASSLWGWLAERYSERKLAMVAMALCGLTVPMMLASLNPLVIMASTGLYGLFARGEGTMFTLILARYFGRRHFGSISGLIAPFSSFGMGISPVLGGVLFDFTGSYLPVFVIMGVGYGFAVLLLLLAVAPRSPQRSSEPASEPERRAIGFSG